MKPLVFAAVLLLGIGSLYSTKGAAEVPPNNRRLPEAADLFERCFAQLGGREKLATITGATVKGKLEEGTECSDFILQVKSPGMLLLTICDAKGRVLRQGRDPRAHFWSQDSKGIRDLDEKAAGNLSALSFPFHPAGLVNLGERLEDAVTEADRTGGHEVYAIGRKRSPALFFRLLFDADSGQLVGIRQTRFADYRDVTNGIQVPFTVREVGRTFHVSSVCFDNSLPEKGFQAPITTSGWMPGMSKMAGSLPTKTLLSGEGRLEVVRHPSPEKRGPIALAQIPRFDPNSGRHAQVDLVSADLRKLDLSNRFADLLHADFNTRTVWPPQLPGGFDPQKILQTGKNPGLGIRKVHAAGITGKGIGIGIIDSALLTDHREFANRLRLYEEIKCAEKCPAHMHGTAVASIALGRTCGVAPGAELYFINASNSRFDSTGGLQLEWSSIAEAVDRLLDLNRALPAANMIRVISLSMGWGPGESGYERVMKAVERARKENVFVLSSVLRRTYGLQFDGLGRQPLADPDDFLSYGPGSWWAVRFWSGEMRFKPGKRLCVPMDGRTTASPVGPEDYTHFDNAGWSWSLPWIAGLYALACEVRPQITPEQFWAEALRTGRTVEQQHDGETVTLGTIADPCALETQVKIDRWQSFFGGASSPLEGLGGYWLRQRESNSL